MGRCLVGIWCSVHCAESLAPCIYSWPNTAFRSPRSASSCCFLESLQGPIFCRITWDILSTAVIRLCGHHSSQILYQRGQEPLLLESESQHLCTFLGTLKGSPLHPSPSNIFRFGKNTSCQHLHFLSALIPCCQQKEKA